MAARLYAPPGPVGAQFRGGVLAASGGSVHAIQGPIGSGKTSLCLVGCGLSLGRLQRPSPIRRDERGRPVRSFKLTTIRDTYRQLWMTTIESWHSWMPASRGTKTGSRGEPYAHTIMMPLPDNTVLEFIAEFVAIGENKVEDVLRGYQPTWAYLNESDLLAIDVLHYMRGRVGRHPGMEHGGPTSWGVMMDLNAPEIDGDLYKLLYEELPEDWKFLTQPGGRDPAAENLPNLPPGYYEAQVKGNKASYIRRMVDNLPGQSSAGKPIYENFNDLRHVSRTRLEPIRGVPLKVGVDAGGSPAAAIGQRLANGQWRILSEVVTEQGTGPTRFAEALSRHLAETYPGWGIEKRPSAERRHYAGDWIEAWGDPSAAYGGDTQGGDLAWLETVSNKAGIRILPAPSNDPEIRWEAVRVPLMQTIDGTEPSFLLSPACPVLRKGFGGMYRFRKLQTPGADRYDDKAEKNAWSHVHDGCQYLMLGGGDMSALLGRKRVNAGVPQRTTAITEESERGSAPVRPQGGGMRNRPASYGE